MSANTFKLSPEIDIKKSCRSTITSAVVGVLFVGTVDVRKRVVGASVGDVVVDSCVGCGVVLAAVGETVTGFGVDCGTVDGEEVDGREVGWESAEIASHAWQK